MIGSERTGASNRTGRQLGEDLQTQIDQAVAAALPAAILAALPAALTTLVVPRTIVSSTEINFAAGQPTSWSFPEWPTTMPGYVFRLVNARLAVSAVAGAHVATPTIQMGSNAGTNNIIVTSTLAAATLNTMVANGATKNAYIALAANSNSFAAPQLNGSPGINCFVGTQASAGTTLRGHLELSGYFMPWIP